MNGAKIGPRAVQMTISSPSRALTDASGASANAVAAAIEKKLAAMTEGVSTCGKLNITQSDANGLTYIKRDFAA